ncbi:MAG TPA: S-methyl-5-thioribose kinase [Candidatus Angelobacter sp.]|nr:S-methyl-5-thioribose kinase [Candidatus Angelobacter sp.]
MTTPATYRELTNETVEAFLKNKKLLAEDVTTSSVEIGDGNLNYVFRVKDTTTGNTLIVKQALPYAKVVGESMPLTLDRARIEREYFEVIEKFTPHLIPKIYAGDLDLAATVMEDLSDYEILRKELIDGKTFPHLGADIGHYLAHNLFYTSDYGLDPQQKKKLVSQFINPELCKITEDLIFTDPFFDHESNDFVPALQPAVEELWADKEVKRLAAKLKRQFVTDASALVHGDLHSGSIFINDSETRVIDPEFAYYGPFGFDIGLFFGNLLLNTLRSEVLGQHELIEEAEHVITETWNTFTATFKELWITNSVDPFTQVEGVLEDLLAQILSDSAGFAGSEVIRRTIGLSHVADLDTLPEKEQLEAKIKALELGRRLIRHHESVTTLSEFLALTKEVQHVE